MKKGQEEAGIVFSLILISLVLTLAFITFTLFGKNSVEQKLYSLKTNELNINLINYLRTFTENNITVSDKIMLAYYTKDYDSIKKLAKEIFSKTFTEDKCPVWNLKASVENNELFEEESSFDISQLNVAGPRPSILDLFGVKKITYYVTNSTIPSYGKDIQVKLIVGCFI